MPASIVTYRAAAALRLVAVAACVGFTAAPAQAEESCEALLNAFNAAFTRNDLQATISAAKPVIEGITCRAVQRDQVGRATALAHLRESEKLADTPANASKKLAICEAGMRFGQPWQLMATIGDLRKEVRNAAGQIDYKGASLAYQSALEDIQDTIKVPVAPPPGEIRRLRQLAAQDSLASKDFVRGGVITKRAVSGVQVDSVPVPLQFVFDKDQMTELGRKYADEMLQVLRGEQMPNIALVGHTDHIGADQYNVQLSLLRAQAVKKFLVTIE